MKKLQPYLYLTPSFIVVICLILVPIVYALFISFIDLTQNVNKLSDSELWSFVGLKNYVEILTSSMFWSTLGRTLYITFVSVGLELFIGLSIALILNEQFVGRGFVRGIMLIPWAFPTIVNAVLWRWFYDPNHGMVNGVLAKAGFIDEGGYINFLGSAFSALNAIIIADVWKNTALVALLLLAALQSIPGSLYEAAQIDGANSWKRFVNVTFPLLAPAILVTLVLRTMEAFKIFDLIYIMTGGGPAEGTQVMSFLTYQQTMMFGKYSYGAAIAFLMSLFVLLFAFIYIKLLYRDLE
jgi:ABC-type sugar transport system permease subunit